MRYYHEVQFVYFGTSVFSAQLLEGLIARGHRPQLVVTGDDARRGRGRQLLPPPVAEMARRHDLHLLQGQANALSEEILAIGADLGLLCAFGQLIREPLLSIPILNLHPSLLPGWRGAAPIERAIAAGDQETGVSIIRLVNELDAGPVAYQQAFPLRGDYHQVAADCLSYGLEACDNVLNRWPELEWLEQTGPISYADKITAADRQLDPHNSAEQLQTQLRAFTHLNPWCELAGERVIIHQARAERASTAFAAVGQVLFHDQELVLVTGHGYLVLDQVQPAGKTIMTGEAWWRGHQ